MLHTRSFSALTGRPGMCCCCSRDRMWVIDNTQDKSWVQLPIKQHRHQQATIECVPSTIRTPLVLHIVDGTLPIKQHHHQQTGDEKLHHLSVPTLARQQRWLHMNKLRICTNTSHRRDHSHHLLFVEHTSGREHCSQSKDIFQCINVFNLSFVMKKNVNL